MYLVNNRCMQSEGLLKLSTVNLTYDDLSQEFMFNNV